MVPPDEEGGEAVQRGWIRGDDLIDIGKPDDRYTNCYYYSSKFTNPSFAELLLQRGEEEGVETFLLCHL